MAHLMTITMTDAEERMISRAAARRGRIRRDWIVEAAVRESRRVVNEPVHFRAQLSNIEPPEIPPAPHTRGER